MERAIDAHDPEQVRRAIQKMRVAINALQGLPAAEIEDGDIVNWDSANNRKLNYDTDHKCLISVF